MVLKNGLAMERSKMIKSWLFVALPVVFLLVLFLFRDSLVGLGSMEIRRMQKKDEATSIADSVRLLYDYSNGQNEYKYTFLEFGAKGCLSCKKMETVMEEVSQEYVGKVKVRFFNLTRKECQSWAQYYGIVTIPTQVVLDHRGCEIFRHSGYISTEDLGKVFGGL